MVAARMFLRFSHILIFQRFEAVRPSHSRTVGSLRNPSLNLTTYQYLISSAAVYEPIPIDAHMVP